MLCVFRYGLGVTQQEMKQELHEYLPSLEHWAKEYLSTSTPKAFSLKVYTRMMLCTSGQTHSYNGETIDCELLFFSLPRTNGSRASGPARDLPTKVTVQELVDIEENVWSPRFGLKGKIDLTARIQIQRTPNRSHRGLEEKTVPLELKTGRESNSVEHRSQVSSQK